MKKIWKVILIIALVLAVLGAAAAAVGYFTGAATERMIEVVIGGRDTLELMLRLLREQLTAIFK